MKMKTQRIACLSLLKENKTFTNIFDGLEYNLFEFLNCFNYAYYQSGVWNDYKRINMQDAIEGAKNSSYGSNIDIELVDNCKSGEICERYKVYFSSPCESDMW